MYRHFREVLSGHDCAKAAPVLEESVLQSGEQSSADVSEDAHRVVRPKTDGSAG